MVDAVTVKGTALVTIPQFVEHQGGAEGYRRWLAALPPGAKQIFSSTLRVSQWYPLEDGFVVPTLALCTLFFRGDLQGAFESGRFSADQSLRGIYKAMVRVGSPQWLVRRARQVFKLYYEPCEMKVDEVARNDVGLHIVSFPGIHAVVEQRIAGFVQRALEISGCKNVKVTIESSLAAGDADTSIHGRWL